MQPSVNLHTAKLTNDNVGLVIDQIVAELNRLGGVSKTLSTYSPNVPINWGVGLAPTAGVTITFANRHNTGYALYIQVYSSQYPYTTVPFSITQRDQNSVTISPLEAGTYECISIG